MKIIAGPCQIESRDHCMMMASRVANIASKLQMDIIFKASFDKANRTSGNSTRGVGFEDGRAILIEVRREFGLKTLTDVHETHQAKGLSGSVSALQIPALLCRQTDLIAAAAMSAPWVNIKKGQFVDSNQMSHAVEKAKSIGCEVWLTERGTFFGYGDLVVDMRSIQKLKPACDAVIFDATHSVQSPGANGSSTGGCPEFSETLARSAIAAGADGLFVETHDDPESAPSDGDVMMPIDKLYDFLARMRDLHAFIRDL